MAIPVGKGLAEQKYCNIMRLVIQRVCRASVAIKGEAVSEIGNGLLVLVGVETGDTEEDMRWLVGKTAGLRIFNDENGVMNRI